MPSRPILVVAFAIGAWSAQAKAQSDPLPAFEKRVERLQAKLESVESVRAIKRLQYAYGHYVELGLWNDFADLFTEDAVTNYQQGVRGKAEIRKLFFEQVGQGKLGLAEGRIYPHILFQPVITLAPDGRTAKGRWRILAILGGYGGSATWYSGVYENEYVLQDGAWKISVLHSEPKVTAAYTAAGWKDSGVRVPFHYTAASVATPIPDSTSRSAKAGALTLASLGRDVSQLAQRASRLNDQAEVTNVLDTYGYAIDRKLWDHVAGFFAENGTLELGMQGVYVGKASIRRGLDQFGRQGIRDGERNDHVYLQTLVSVAPDGRTAKARGVELIFSNTSGGSELSEGVFENSFVKRDGKWKIQSVHFYPRMIVDAAAGWAKSAKPAPAPSKEFPPDRPPTAFYDIYPKFAVAPFHFDNPATGKPPQYPEGTSFVARPTTGAPPTNGPAIRNAKDLEIRLAKVERSLAAAEAYDIAGNLIDAQGYSQDDSPAANGGSIFASQILQPVIDIAPDGKSAKVQARRLDLGGASGGAGYWTAGTLEGQIVSEQGAWRFQLVRSTSRWSAPYPGGWARIP
ncbi:MAG: nuclear transport factor 2 family protein [Acidobacteriota bacterium]